MDKESRFVLRDSRTRLYKAIKGYTTNIKYAQKFNSAEVEEALLRMQQEYPAVTIEEAPAEETN